MFFVLSKLLDLLFSPLFWALLLGAVALALRARRPQLARGLGTIALVTLYLPSTGGGAWLLTRHVERFDGPVVRPGVHYDAVVVLGGFIRQPDALADIELAEAGDRILRTWEMARDGRADRVVILGGSGYGGPPEADLAAALLRALGVPERAMLLDRRSRNTRENAEELQKIVRAHGLGKLALVTSAYHMQRALGCLRAVGLSADALATDHLLPRLTAFELIAPRAGMLAQSELALRELAGRGVYRLRGYAR